MGRVDSRDGRRSQERACAQSHPLGSNLSSIDLSHGASLQPGSVMAEKKGLHCTKDGAAGIGI